MTRRLLLIIVSLFLAPASLLAEYECAAAKDLVVRSIEGLHGGTQRADLVSGLSKLSDAEGICRSFGDLWYYKALFTQQMLAMDGLRATPAQRYKLQATIDDALRNAETYKSAAMKDQLSPFTLAVPKDRPEIIGPVRQKWALVVGIGTFNAKFPSLLYTSKDAKDMADALVDPKVGRFEKNHVRLLTDKEATLVSIRAELNSIARQADSNDLVFIFIASHGTSRLKDEVGGLNYIVTYDTAQDNPDLLYASSLAMVDLSQLVRSRIKAQRAVIVLDTCFSGGVGKNSLSSTAPSSGDMDVLKAGAGRIVISSSSDKQQSNEGGSIENGVFTYFFLEGLRRNQGKSPLNDIFAYVSQSVPRFTQANKMSTQTPMMFSSTENASIVLGADTKPDVASVAPPGLISQSN